MPVIKISEVKEGMVLADDVLNERGQLLLRQETELTARSLKILKSWRVGKINVRGKETLPQKSEQEVKKEISEYIASLDQIFSQHKKDAFMSELFRVSVKQFKESIAE